MSIHLVHPAVFSATRDIELIPNKVKILAASFTFPNSRKTLVVDISIAESFVQKIGTATVNRPIGHYVSPKKWGCVAFLISEFVAFAILLDGISAKDYIEIGGVVLGEPLTPVVKNCVINIFIKARIAVFVLGIWLYYEVIEADFLFAYLN